MSGPRCWPAQELRDEVNRLECRIHASAKLPKTILNRQNQPSHIVQILGLDSRPLPVFCLFFYLTYVL